MVFVILLRLSKKREDKEGNELTLEWQRESVISVRHTESPFKAFHPFISSPSPQNPCAAQPNYSPRFQGKKRRICKNKTSRMRLIFSTHIIKVLQLLIEVYRAKMGQDKSSVQDGLLRGGGCMSTSP